MKIKNLKKYIEIYKNSKEDLQNFKKANVFNAIMEINEGNEKPNSISLNKIENFNILESEILNDIMVYTSL